MSSIHGLPLRGSDAKVLLTRVHIHPLSMLVEFWGKFSLEKTEQFECLAKDIQSPGKPFQFLDGVPGDQCLVQIDNVWYRCRIVSGTGSNYSVFLIDKGITCHSATDKLAWGRKEHFLLPPEVEFCVLANVLPVSLENKWSPVALDFLRSLPGKCVNAHVQEVLVQQRIFVLHVPCLSKQMYEMGFAKKLSPESFQGFLLASLQSKNKAEQAVAALPQAKEADERLQKQHDFFYPELPEETVETVIVTEVVNPQIIFCQLKVFSRELTKLSEQLRRICEGRVSTCVIDSEMIASPCAARGPDGRWYRSVLQQVFPTNKVMEVLNVDYGTKQFVQMKNIRPLGGEFFRMPVVTYLCSLHGVSDKGLGWTTSQTEYLRSLLLSKTVIAKFEYQSASEGVHFVTFYGDDDTNINNMFSLKEKCLPQSEKIIQNNTIQNSGLSQQESLKHRKTLSHPLEIKQVTDTLPIPIVELSLNSTYVASVQHVSNPSEFWIQIQTHAQEVDNLMDRIYHLYKDSPSKDAVKNPSVGLYCAAKLENGDIYRAIVAEVGETQVKVFLVDYGNSEVVDRVNIRPLPTAFKMLPRQALKCSLSGVKPKDRKWSQNASDFFYNVVMDKTLNALITAKYDDGYAVQLSEPRAQGEQDVSAMMCSLDFAEKAEVQRQSKNKITTQSDVMLVTQHPDGRMSSVSVNREVSCPNKNLTHLAKNEKRVTTYKEHMFPIGSVLDVNVSFIKSPNDFWCQLAHNAGYLKVLMHELQVFYADSVFVPPIEMTCVVRHPKNGRWYRGLVINKHETPHLDVLLVDYGQTKTVSLYDLRKIQPEFLTLNGQAFRCSLMNPAVPTLAAIEWNEEATARFKSFVETAASNCVILKCTIFAVMYSEQKIMFNVVDLETPFESICTTMVSLIKSAPEKAQGQSLRLDSYYYSTHNVKTGTEERVTVTCVNDIGQFYCQLEKNTEVLKSLQKKVSNLCHQLEKEKLPKIFGTLCFARYTDGQWYRGHIKATKPALVVHFVDYGNTNEVANSDLLPVPKEASDIMSVPVQAVVCGLSDVGGDIPTKAVSWFENTVTEVKFRALIVGKEPDGKLLVELYQGDVQINAKVKKLFQIKTTKDEQVVYQRQRRPEITKPYPKQANGDQLQPMKRNSITASKPHQKKDECKSTDSDPALMSKNEMGTKSQSFKSAVTKFYTPPPQRQSGDSLSLPKYQNDDMEAKHLKSKSPISSHQKENEVKKLPKLADLPPQSIAADMVAEVYVSHCNSPLSFYVQCIRDEAELFSLVEKLNNPQTTADANKIENVQPGDLVQAEFADDSSWYRAVVQEVHDKTEALVEFVDFGNTAMTSFSNLRRLDESLLRLPSYCTHCILSGAVSLRKEIILDPDVVSAFKEDISGSSEEKIFRCRFIKNVEAMWEVSLEDCGVDVVCKVPTRLSEVTSEDLEKESVQMSEKVPVKPHSLQYHQQEFLEGQQLQVFITAINDDQTFWCQSANSERLSKISSLAEVGNKIDHQCIIKGALLSGSSCIALYSEDQLWYRAEVIDTKEDELNVLFVDYGNTSQVNMADVREISSDMMEIPQQAFLCFLEGFDLSCGSWVSSAYNELSTLLMDKSLELTVTKVTKEEGKIKLAVQLEFEGVVINETMKSWWKCSLVEPEQPPPEQGSNVTESAGADEPQEEVKSSVGLTISESKNHDQHRVDTPNSSRLVEVVSMSLNSSDIIVNPEESENPEVSTELLKEETVPADEDGKLTEMAETSEVPVDDKDGQEVLSSGSKTCFNADNEKESESMVNPVEKEDFYSPAEEQPLETEVFNEEPQHEEVNSSSDSSSNISGPAEQVHGRKALKDCPVSRMTSVRMVPCEALTQINKFNSQEDSDTNLEVPSQIQTEPIPPINVHSAELLDILQEQEPEERNVAQDEGAGVSAAPEIELICENKMAAHQEEALADVDDAPTELHPDNDPPPEETRLSDICTESKESSDECEGDCQSSETAEEVIPQTEVDLDQQKEKLLDDSADESTEVNNEPLETSVVSVKRREEFEEEDSISNEDDQNLESASFDEQDFYGSASDTETVVCKYETPEMVQLMDEVTGLVGDISLSDSCPDLLADAEDSDLLVSTLPQETPELDDRAVTEEMSAENSLAPTVADDSPL
ncbi:tudor domain-containing 6 [Gouania willdenowi]|uniref:Tudor domain-containing protein 6-like n=1 Tax=Gouania willdenowi TaxID=441366 RepID=A0A8C5I420_GOUWI|nr:tudor domain-containing protein 6-like [Gouania willdenowi]